MPLFLFRGYWRTFGLFRTRRRVYGLSPNARSSRVTGVAVYLRFTWADRLPSSLCKLSRGLQLPTGGMSALSTYCLLTFLVAKRDDAHYT